MSRYIINPNPDVLEFIRDLVDTSENGIFRGPGYRIHYSKTVGFIITARNGRGYLQDAQVIKCIDFNLLKTRHKADMYYLLSDFEIDCMKLLRSLYYRAGSVSPSTYF